MDMGGNEKGDAESKAGLLGSSLVVSAMTMISRVFGLARDMVIAYFFGSSAGADAFFLSFRIPNFFRRLFAEGAFQQAFVPVLTEYRQQRPTEVQGLVDKTAGTLGASLAVITLLGVVGAELLISVFAAGYIYHDESLKLALATDMLRLTFPYLMLISLTAFAGAILNTFGRFAAPAFTPVLLNLSLILAAIYLRDYLAEPALALAWGVLIAGVAQLSMQLPFLQAESVLPRPRVDFRDTGVRKILTLMLPAIFGVSVSQINLLVDTVLASFLQTGTLSWLYYSDRLLELPLALFGIAIATVILPRLSRDFSQADKSLEDSSGKEAIEEAGSQEDNSQEFRPQEAGMQKYIPQENSQEVVASQEAGSQGKKPASGTEFSATLNWSMKLILLLGLPASAALMLLADELIATLFYQGQMTERDVAMASLALSAYGLGLLGHMLVKVLAPGYFARQDTKTPVRYGVMALLANILLNLALVWHLAHVGLALATSLAAFVNAGLLFFGLRRTGVLTTAGEGWLLLIARAGLATLVMVASLLLMMQYLFPESYWLQASFAPRLVWMLLTCVGGVAIYAATLALSGLNFKKLKR